MIVSALFCAGAVHAQGWSPQRNVEIVAGVAAGGGVDKTARTVERLLLANKLVKSSITVVNKPGGGNSIAYTYVSQRPADGHTLMVVGAPLLTNHIMGSSSLNYTDFTTIASLCDEHVAYSVNAASPMRTGKDLVERLKKDPKSVTIGFTVIGGSTHLAAALLNKVIGGNAKDLKAVSFKGGAEVLTTLLGGHIDLATTAASVATPHLATGRLRVVAVAAPKRLGGALAGIPTWKEQSVDLVFNQWRFIIGPKGMAPAQTAYWESALKKVTETAEWKTDIEQNFWSDNFVTGEPFRKNLAQDYATMKSVLVDLGLAKQ